MRELNEKDESSYSPRVNSEESPSMPTDSMTPRMDYGGYSERVDEDLESLWESCPTSIRLLIPPADKRLEV